MDRAGLGGKGKFIKTGPEVSCVSAAASVLCPAPQKRPHSHKPLEWHALHCDVVFLGCSWMTEGCHSALR